MDGDFPNRIMSVRNSVFDRPLFTSTYGCCKVVYRELCGIRIAALNLQKLIKKMNHFI